MDAAGKDSAIKHVMSGVNPQGCQVFSFKHPSTEELQHDFLWNATRRLPERGHIGIFNRSYYEEVLIVRVHREILSSEIFRGAGRQKAFLARPVSFHRKPRGPSAPQRHTRHKVLPAPFQGEQKKRFLKRIDDPEKNWKFSADDIKERKYWRHYMKAYEECLSATSTHNAPVYSSRDDKENTG